MAGNECKCLNPESGGTKCPPQHVAICLRGRDGECYGECVAIPGNYHYGNRVFFSWTENQIRRIIVYRINNDYDEIESEQFLRKISGNTFQNGGEFKFIYDRGPQPVYFHVRFSFKFTHDSGIQGEEIIVW